VLAYAPDPLLTYANVDQLLVRQEDPPLAIDPELMRVITHDESNDNAGIDAMQEMAAEPAVRAGYDHVVSGSLFTSLPPDCTTSQTNC